MLVSSSFSCFLVVSATFQWILSIPSRTPFQWKSCRFVSNLQSQFKSHQLIPIHLTHPISPQIIANGNAIKTREWFCKFQLKNRSQPRNIASVAFPPLLQFVTHSECLSCTNNTTWHEAMCPFMDKVGKKLSLIKFNYERKFAFFGVNGALREFIEFWIN
jgi:hypothetical protein